MTPQQRRHQRCNSCIEPHRVWMASHVQPLRRTVHDVHTAASRASSGISKARGGFFLLARRKKALARRARAPVREPPVSGALVGTEGAEQLLLMRHVDGELRAA